MNLENLLGLPESSIEAGISLEQILETTLAQGWKEVNFGFNLGKRNSGLDIFRGEQRVLIYRASLVDEQTYDLFETIKIPHFPVCYTPLDKQDRIFFGTVEIPVGTRGLDSMRYPDQKQVTGYLGSVEIMRKIAELLALIYKTTSRVVPELKLSKLALIPGADQPIRIIPPLELIGGKSWNHLVGQLANDLKFQDPNNNHSFQVEMFQRQFGEILRT